VSQNGTDNVTPNTTVNRHEPLERTSSIHSYQDAQVAGVHALYADRAYEETNPAVRDTASRPRMNPNISPTDTERDERGTEDHSTPLQASQDGGENIEMVAMAADSPYGRLNPATREVPGPPPVYTRLTGV